MIDDDILASHVRAALDGIEVPADGAGAGAGCTGPAARDPSPRRSRCPLVRPSSRAARPRSRAARPRSRAARPGPGSPDSPTDRLPVAARVGSGRGRRGPRSRSLPSPASAAPHQCEQDLELVRLGPRPSVRWSPHGALAPAADPTPLWQRAPFRRPVVAGRSQRAASPELADAHPRRGDPRPGGPDRVAHPHRRLRSPRLHRYRPRQPDQRGRRPGGEIPDGRLPRRPLCRPHLESPGRRTSPPFCRPFVAWGLPPR